MDRVKYAIMLALCSTLSLSAVGCEDEGDDPSGDGDGDGDNPGDGDGDGDDPGDGDGDGDDPGDGDGDGDDAGVPGDGGDGDGACDLSGEGKERVTLTSPTGTMTLTSDKVWVLETVTYVNDGETLTIEPCTRVEGIEATPPATLVVSRGGKIMASGSANAPILFTADVPPGEGRPGLWGGVILLGRAPNNRGTEVQIEGLAEAPANRHGGTDAADSSGSMSYVRIEYGGFQLNEGNEINGLTLGSVGTGTTIDHIEVNTSQDDCFEFFGGTVNASYLVCNNGGDDMFDADHGYTGTLQYLFGRMSETSSSDPSGFEMDSNPDNTNPPVTLVTANHVTLCGSGETELATTRGMVLRRNMTGAFDDVVVTGFNVGVDARDAFGTVAAPSVTMTNAQFFGQLDRNLGPDESEAAADNDMGFVEEDWFAAGTGNSVPDPVPFPIADCVAADGPAASVTGSGKGAFTGGGDWLQGLWLSWAVQ